MFKPTITDMEDKYCGNYDDIYDIFKANTKETTKEMPRPEAAPPLLCAANGRHLCSGFE